MTAVMTAAKTAPLPKRSRGGKGPKVDTETVRKEGEMRTAAQGPVRMKHKRRDGLTDAKSENRTPTETQTRGQTRKRRGEKTGKQQVGRAQVILLQIEMHGHGQTLGSGKDRGKLLQIPLFTRTAQRDFLCSALLYCILSDINKPLLSASSVGALCSSISSLGSAAQAAGRGMVEHTPPVL